MRIAVVTLFPVMIREALEHGVVGRALQRGVLEVEYFDPRDYADHGRGKEHGHKTPHRPRGGLRDISGPDPGQPALQDD